MTEVFRDQMFRPARTKIVRTARSWIGTKYHAEQCVKGEGVDCINLFKAIAEEIGIKLNVPAEPTIECLSAIELFPVHLYQPGDILVYDYGTSYHFAIASDWGIIHASRLFGEVVEQMIPMPMLRRFKGAYTLFPEDVPNVLTPTTDKSCAIQDYLELQLKHQIKQYLIDPDCPNF